MTASKITARGNIDMMKRLVLVVCTLVVEVLPLVLQAQQQQRPAPVPSIDDRTNGMRKIDGYFPLYWEERTGSMFLEIPRLDTDFLFTLGLSAGLGSNDVGLDRGQGGGGRIVQFRARNFHFRLWVAVSLPNASGSRWSAFFVSLPPRHDLDRPNFWPGAAERRSELGARASADIPPPLG
jgi:hypothetical protein